MTAAISLADVSVRLGGRVVLAHLSFSVPHGAFVGVFGANGAGKTTLLRALAGLVRPQSGRVEVLGETPARIGRRIGYLPQSGALPPDIGLSGRDFVAACGGGGGWGLPILNTVQREDVDRVLRVTDTSALADRPVGALSGGERQRLMLAQALLGQPDLLLLDEPLAGLDPRHQAASVALVRRLQQQLGLTILVTAHDLNLLMGVMDQVIFLGSGQAVCGPVGEVVDSRSLSRLYGAPVEVVRAAGHVFVVMASGEAAAASGSLAGQGVHAGV
jgi:zinc/manganese transport system ATP-binding protein